MRKNRLITISLAMAMLCSGCGTVQEMNITAEDVIGMIETVQDTVEVIEQAAADKTAENNTNTTTVSMPKFDYSSIPTYSGNAYCVVNDHKPFFDDLSISAEPFERYGELDALGRCTTAIACLGEETMPAAGEERESISSVKPTGWVQNKYDCVEGGWIVNRAHMVMWALSAENANAKNLVTGTRYMNLEMLEFENLLVDYIRETGNHVMYRVTPVFVGNELMCRGLLMEAQSVEDNGEGIEFCVFMYNVQPGIEFDYATGDNWYTGEFLDTDSPAVNYIG